MSMLLITNPSMFNGVIIADNMFGDLLSDQAGGIIGTLGLVPSASLCDVADGRSCMQAEATAIENAVEKVLDGKDIGGLKVRTRDLGGHATMEEVGDAVYETLD
ncbi:hypothetical protein AYO21_02966 [Fonsecaea monophora]|uniref:3-isopropylmalate dehydrogenase n=1 Tax=Fonsecaea monophora TaxID=254056 RepID=A0A177FEK9_9EURO|nr:hypothetical protein AYO21_02966 [Fonsecaea monophora]OAG42683.1 hypothetical protein AYO21_02966 [Fonsecaea monophora]